MKSLLITTLLSAAITFLAVSASQAGSKGSTPCYGTALKTGLTGNKYYAIVLCDNNIGMPCTGSGFKNAVWYCVCGTTNLGWCSPAALPASE